MKKYFTIILIYLTGLTYSQESSLYVKFSYFNTNSRSNEKEYAELINSGNKSLFILYTKKLEMSTAFMDENNKMTGDYIEYKDEVYKDFNQNILYAKSPIPFTKKLVIKDSLNNLNWIITDEHKEILGYTCTKAKTTFHGRDYSAFFAEPIAIFDGPWKFSGLPGLILELKEDTGMLEILAYELKIEEKSIEINNSLDTKNSFYWTELIEKAKIKLKSFVNESKIEDPLASSKIDSNNSLEIFGVINE